MLRFKTVSSSLFGIAAVLVGLVFILHILAPSHDFPIDTISNSDKRYVAMQFFPHHWLKNKATTVFIPAEPNRQVTEPVIKCREILVTIERYRSRPVVRGVIVRFPSLKSDYYFVQFRWFYRSWIESEMFTLERWRTDIIILVDDQFPSKTQQSLEELNCRADNGRASRRQISRCIIVNHKLFSQRQDSERQYYIEKYPMLNSTSELDDKVDRIFAIYDYTSQLNKSQIKMYDFLMITTMNTFLTTQFGKYVPLKCTFLIGAYPDFSTWYGKTDQIVEFVDTLLTNLKEAHGTRNDSLIDFSLTIEILKKTMLFSERQIDVPCDSKITVYRTSVFHLKCYAHSTSLFSERMFRDNAYDGFDKQPFNIYVAREYATLMALQSKTMSLHDLHLLAVNVTRRDV